MKMTTDERQLDLFNSEQGLGLQDLANRDVPDLVNEAKCIIDILEDMKKYNNRKTAGCLATLYSSQNHGLDGL